MRGEYSKYIKNSYKSIEGEKKNKKFDLKMGREQKMGRGAK